MKVDRYVVVESVVIDCYNEGCKSSHHLCLSLPMTKALPSSFIASTKLFIIRTSRRPCSVLPCCSFDPSSNLMSIRAPSLQAFSMANVMRECFQAL